MYGTNSGDRAALSTTLAQPWAGQLGSAAAERAATQADVLGGAVGFVQHHLPKGTWVDKQGKSHALSALYRPKVAPRDETMTAASSAGAEAAAAAAAAAASAAHAREAAEISAAADRCSSVYQPEVVSSAGFLRSNGGRFLADQGLMQIERHRQGDPGAPAAGGRPKELELELTPAASSRTTRVGFASTVLR
jgi:hypothetical protein|eukprot:COSAG06_NODE_877_length_11814_cov_7.238327_4_plen_192_part_00